MTSLLDYKIRKILEPYQIVRARPGEPLTCSCCEKNVEFAYRTLCGKCFLAGREPETN